MKNNSFPSLRGQQQQAKRRWQQDVAIYVFLSFIIKNAKQTWRRLVGRQQLGKIILEVKVSDGCEGKAIDDLIVTRFIQ